MLRIPWLPSLFRYDIVVDATDNAPSRYMISDCCVVLGKVSLSVQCTFFWMIVQWCMNWLQNMAIEVFQSYLPIRSILCPLNVSTLKCITWVPSNSLMKQTKFLSFFYFILNQIWDDNASYIYKIFSGYIYMHEALRLFLCFKK